MLTRFLPDRRRAALLLLSLAVPGTASGQSARVTVERENFRATPRGTVVAELLQGAELRLGEAQGRWREATLTAWIWGASVQEAPGGPNALAVRSLDGENLRAGPNGTRIGLAYAGMRLERVENRGDWVRVRRTGWIWQPSLDVEEAESAAPDATPAAPPAAPPAQEASTRERSAAPARRQEVPGPTSTARSGGREFLAAGSPGLVVLDGPAGDTVARVQPGGSVEVVAREGDWTRVRVEGWVATGSLSPDSVTGSVLRDMSMMALQADPERVRGRLLEWTIQFISLQHAEPFRTDFLEGEAFMLARGPGTDAGFVYVAVPPEREAEVKRLTPLQRVRILARIRTARSRLTEAPVLDLIEITPLR